MLCYSVSLSVYNKRLLCLGPHFGIVALFSRFHFYGICILGVPDPFIFGPAWFVWSGLQQSFWRPVSPASVCVFFMVHIFGFPLVLLAHSSGLPVYIHLFGFFFSNGFRSCTFYSEFVFIYLWKPLYDKFKEDGSIPSKKLFSMVSDLLTISSHWMIMMNSWDLTKIFISWNGTKTWKWK